MFYYEVSPIGGKIYDTYTYKYEEKLSKGQRVIINMRGNQSLGLIIKESTNIDSIKIKEIDFILDEKPLINENIFDLIFESTKKFLLPLSEVIRFVFPPLSYDLFRIKIMPLNELSPIQKPTFLNEYYKNFENKKEAKKKLKELINLNIVKLELHEKTIKNKKEWFLSLNKDLKDIMNINISAQAQAVVNYLMINGEIPEKLLYEENIIKKSSSVLKTLKKKGILKFSEKKEIIIKKEVDLSLEQENAVKTIFLKKDKPHLLYGVTGSGKTEVFFEVAEPYLKQNKKVLIMVPEISLAPQMYKRLKNRFLNYKLGVYHSSMTNSERINVWYGAQKGDYDIIIGTRSSVWLPIKDLSMIIIDEEHDNSYYQLEQGSYDAIEVALMRKKFENLNIVLASATPRLVDYKRALEEKYYLETIKNRFYSQMPEIEILDLKSEEKYNWIFSKKTIKKIYETIKKDKKVIVFTPTRGYANYVICSDCGYIFKCENCDVSYTYHKKENKLKCHYCGEEKNTPASCPNCKSIKLQTRGYGTEKVVNDLMKAFPSVPIVRVDRTVINNYDELKDTFNYMHEKGRKIIVGTKMITKGLDIEDLDLVVILDSDRYAFLPDYTAEESAASLIMQVAGRAGRKEKGNVIIQTFKNDSKMFEHIKNNDYDSIIKSELLKREKYNYPPYSDMYLLIIQNESREDNNKMSNLIYEELKNLFPNTEILGPVEPLIYKLRNKYRKYIMIKEKIDNVKLLKIQKKYNRNLIIHSNPPTTLL